MRHLPHGTIDKIADAMLKAYLKNPERGCAAAGLRHSRAPFLKHVLRVLTVLTCWCACLVAAKAFAASTTPRAELVSLLPHSSAINAVAVTSDGRFLATGSEDYWVKLWDLASGRMLHTFPASAGVVFDLAFSPDGTKLAIACFDASVIVWNIPSLQMAYRISEDRGSTYGVAFSPDGKKLAVSSRSKTVRVLATEDGKLLQTFSDLAQPTGALRFNEDGSLLAAGSTEGLVAVWDEKGLKYKWTHGRSVLALSFLEESKRLVAGGPIPYGLRFWDLSNGEPADLLRFRQVVRAIEPLDRQTFAVIQNAFVYLRQNSAGQVLRILGQRTASALDLAATTNGVLCVGRSDGTVDVWNWREGKLLRVLNDPPQAQTNPYAEERRITFSPDGRWLASTFDVQRIAVWNSETMEARHVFSPTVGLISDIEFSPDNRLLAAACEDRTVRIWQMGDGREAKVLRGHTEPVRAIAFSNDGKLLASGGGIDEGESQERGIRIWNTESGQQVQMLSNNWKGLVRSIAFQPGDEVLLAVERHASMTFWDLKTELPTRSISDGYTRLAKFSPNGKYIAASQIDRRVRLYDAQTGKRITDFEPHDHNTTRLNFSADSRWLASGSVDGFVRVWDLNNFQLAASFDSAAGQIMDVAFHPLLPRLACITLFEPVQIWDLPRREKIYRRIESASGGWIGFNPRTLRYHAAGDMEQYMNVRFDRNVDSLYPLSFYRDALRINDGRKVLSGVESPRLAPRPWRLAWSRFHYWIAILWALGALGVALLIWSLLRNWRLQRVRATQIAFARHLLESQEAERKRIADELHDGLGHQLLLIKNRAVLAANEAKAGSNVAGALEEISQSASQSIQEARQISYNLRPFQVDRLGLTRALQSLARDFGRSSGLDFHASVAPIDDALSPDQQMNLYRVVQESLNNIARHSGAARAELEIWDEASRVHVRVTDDGRGFDFERVKEHSNGQSGFGLSGISERVRILGGTWRCESKPGEGTKLSFEIPAFRGKKNGEPGS